MGREPPGHAAESADGSLGQGPAETSQKDQTRDDQLASGREVQQESDRSTAEQVAIKAVVCVFQSQTFQQRLGQLARLRHFCPGLREAAKGERSSQDALDKPDQLWLDHERLVLGG